MTLETLILTVATLTGLYMAWNIGANDVANAMGTSVGSGALTLRAAIVVAAFFEFSGATLVGSSVTQTIAKGIVDVSAFGKDGTAFAVAMCCCLFAAAIWLHIATYAGWPVSTTHSIVGAVIGVALLGGGVDSVAWGKVLQIAASWIISPVMGGLIGFGVFSLLRQLILANERPLVALRRWGPFMIFPVFSVLALSMMYKGLKPLRLDLSLAEALPISLGTGLLATLVAIPLLRRAGGGRDADDSVEPTRRIERVFLVLQVFTACLVAFAHGSNDVANAIGPLAAVDAALRHGLHAEVDVPTGILLIGAVGIVLGLATYGYRVMGTIGKEITELTPSRGFCAEFAAATTILVASKLGLPVSTTHTLVGAVIGVGFARSIGAINMQVLRGIFASWFITVPFTAMLAAGIHFCVRLAL